MRKRLIRPWQMFTPLFHSYPGIYPEKKDSLLPSISQYRSTGFTYHVITSPGYLIK